MPIFKKLEKLKLNREQQEFLDQIRDVRELTYYKNFNFSRDFLATSYNTVEHVWSQGDKLYKLANVYYGDKNLFWVIGLYNNKPTDAHFNFGDVVFIPIDFYSFINDVVK